MIRTWTALARWPPSKPAVYRLDSQRNYILFVIWSTFMHIKLIINFLKSDTLDHTLDRTTAVFDMRKNTNSLIWSNHPRTTECQLLVRHDVKRLGPQSQLSKRQRKKLLEKTAKNTQTNNFYILFQLNV